MGNYLGQMKKQLRFQREFIFQHFKSSDISSFHRTLSDEGELGGRLFEQIHLTIPVVHVHI